MFERVIAQTIQRITTDVLHERSSISLVEILEDERIPARLKPFFETEVQWWLYNEMLARSANKRFNYDHPELASLLSYLEQVQFRHARFEREDFLTVLDSAVKLTYNFLCRPQTTLKWYIFRGQPVKPLREVMLRFGAFLDYEYFPNVFSEWVERKQHERPTFDGISSTEFERVIRRTDDQILLNCTVEDLLAILNPIFEFIGDGPEMQVPIDALIIFFDDKNIKKLVDYLERCREQGREMVSREDFVTLLDELLSSSEDEPEADFSNVYQNDELDDVVRLHLQAEGKTVNLSGPEYPQMEHVDEGESNGQMSSPEATPAAISQTPTPGHQHEIGRRDERSGADVSASWISPEQHRTFIEAFGTASAEHAIQQEARELANGREEENRRIGESVNRGEEENRRIGESVNRGDEEIEGIVAESSLDGDDEPASEDIPESESGDRMPEVFSTLERVATESTNGSDEGVLDEASEEHLLIDDEEEDEEEIAVEEEPLESSTARLPIQSDATRNGADSERILEDVRRFIDPMLERKVIKRIFDKNRDEYESALDRLNAASNWRAASQVLDELFSRYNVDSYSRTAIRFTDSVYGRYLPR